MKKFLIIFLVMQLFLMGYIFDCSIYNIFEKNNIGDTSLNGYIVVDSTGDNLNNIFNIISEDYPNAKLQIKKYSVDAYDNSVYKIYSNSRIQPQKTMAISNDLTFEYYELNREDFLDNSGIFYTDLSDIDVNDISSNLGIAVEKYKNDFISYSNIIKFNLYNLLVLLAVSQLIYFIYTSSNLKEISAKKALGFSNFRIVMDIVRSMCKYNITIISGLTIVRMVQLLFIGNFNIRYFFMFICFYIAVFGLNIIQTLITTILIRYINIAEMVKNREFLKQKFLLISVVKIVFLVAVTLTFSSIVTTINDYKAAEKNILKLGNLSNYYSAYGFYSDEYERLNAIADIRNDYSAAMKRFYCDKNNEGIAFLCNAEQIGMYLTSSFLSNNGLSREQFYREYSLNYLIANETFLLTNSIAKYIDGQKSVPYILVPNMYIAKESEIKEYFIEYYNSMIQYDKYYGQTNTTFNLIDNIDIKYIDNDIEFDILISDGYITVKNTIIVIDKQLFGGLYYLDALNSARSLFFDYSSRDALNADLTRYGLSDLVIPATLITPFSSRLETVKFTLNMLTVFLSLFIATLAFIIFAANYTDIITHRKKYAIETILGFTTKAILFNQIVVSTVLVIASTIIGLVFPINTLIFTVTIFIDILILVVLYKVYVVNKLVDLQKGA